MRARLAAALLAAAAAAHAQGDAAHAGWRLRHRVTVPAASGMAALALPAEIATECQPGLADLRLADAAGADVAYAVDRREDRVSEAVWVGRLMEARAERRAQSVWVVDLGDRRPFDRVWLEVPGQDFAKSVRVETSDDGSAWSTAREDAAVFDRAWGVRVHHTAVDLPGTVTARYVRVTADDRRSPPLEPKAIAVSRVRDAPGQGWSRAAALVAQPAPRRGVSRFRLEAPAGLPFERLELQSSEAAFARHVVVLEERPGATRPAPVAIGEGDVYRLRVPDVGLAVDERVVSVAPPRGGAIFLEVQDGDSPPLRQPSALVSAPAVRLVFSAAPSPVALFCGNPAASAPRYDVQALDARIAAASGLADASLGTAEANPVYRAETPLPFVAARGARLEVGDWAYARALRIPSDEVHALVLAPEDVALLQPGALDLRIVDAEGLQVPYVLEPDAGDARVPVVLDRAAARPGVSRHALRPRSALAAAVPWQTLELEVAEPFFARSARVLWGRPGHERAQWTGTLSRLPDQPAVLRVPLRGARATDMVLEVDEGDDAPLTVRSAAVVVPVPRAVFRAAAGEYRALLGNPRARAPQYDLGQLRSTLLSYAAAAVEPGPLAPNASHHAGAADWLRRAPPTALLWGALLGAMAALVLLTVRILGGPRPPAA